jgi:hypothetical protein
MATNSACRHASLPTRGRTMQISIKSMNQVMMLCHSSCQPVLSRDKLRHGLLSEYGNGLKYALYYCKIRHLNQIRLLTALPTQASVFSNDESALRTSASKGRRYFADVNSFTLPQKPRSSPSWIARPICSTPPLRPLYHKSHFLPS